MLSSVKALTDLRFQRIRKLPDNLSGTRRRRGGHTASPVTAHPKAKDAHSPIASIFAKKEAKEPSFGPSSSQSPLASNKKRKAADVPPLASQSTKRRKDLSSSAPLAERLRPKTLDDFVGHQAVIGPDSLLRSMIKSGSTGSMILWGPPGYAICI